MFTLAEENLVVCNSTYGDVGVSLECRVDDLLEGSTVEESGEGITLCEASLG